MSSKRKWRLARTIVVATLLVVVAVVWGLSKSGVFQTKTLQAQTAPVVRPTQANEWTKTDLLSVWKADSMPATPTAEFVIVMPRRDGHKLNADGVEKRGDAKAFRAQIAEQAKHDPLTLYLYYQASPLGRKKPLSNETVLVKDGRIENGNVYSELGVQAYKDWLFLWELTDIKAVNEISFQGANTGVSGTKTTQSGGVGGKDKSGFDITYRDANDDKSDQHSALYRCTQPTSGRGIPGVHEGPTDNPKIPPRRIAVKDTSKDVGVNPRVAPWKQDGGEKHVVTRADGSKVSIGLQTNPARDAAVAAAKAAAEAAANAAAQQAAIDAAKATGGGVVDSNQQHSVTTTPGAGW